MSSGVIGARKEPVVEDRENYRVDHRRALACFVNGITLAWFHLHPRAWASRTGGDSFTLMAHNASINPFSPSLFRRSTSQSLASSIAMTSHWTKKSGAAITLLPTVKQSPVMNACFAAQFDQRLAVINYRVATI